MKRSVRDVVNIYNLNEPLEEAWTISSAVVLRSALR